MKQSDIFNPDILHHYDFIILQYPIENRFDIRLQLKNWHKEKKLTGLSFEHLYELIETFFGITRKYPHEN